MPHFYLAIGGRIFKSLEVRYMISNRVLVLLVQHMCDIIKIAPDAESNIVMTIRKYEGLCDDILIAVHEVLYQKTMVELDKVVDPSKIFMVNNYYCAAHAMAQVAERMRKTAGMSTKTAICVRPMLLDVGGGIYASGDIRDYIKKATEIAEKRENVVMATAEDDLVCKKTLRVADVGVVRFENPVESCDYSLINTVGAKYTYCDAGIYFWRPSVYLDAIGRVKKAKKAYDTMAKLASSLADLGTPVLTPCCLFNWRPIIEWYWPAPISS